MKTSDKESMIKLYNDGRSFNEIARIFSTYPTTVKRILEKNNVTLRHDAKTKGTFHVENGEELIDWAKKQGRLVTRKELADILGKTRLSNSYFKKHPELSKYIAPHKQKELIGYYEKLYTWLQENDIPYKPNDKEALGVTVDAALLGEYSNFLLQIDIKPSCVSIENYNKMMDEKHKRAGKADKIIIFITKESFENLDVIKDMITQKWTEV